MYGGDRRRCRGCAAPRSQLWPGSPRSTTTKLERGDATGVSDSVIDGLAHALQLDEAERAHLDDLLRTAGTTRAAAPPARPASGSGPPSSASSTPCTGTPAFVLNGRLDILAANDLGRALFSPVYADPDGTANNARFVFLDPQRHRVLPRLGQGRQRHRRPPARRSRPRPLRPRPLRPDRAALHPQRRVPPPLGRPQRPHPHHRRQAPPPPRRRRPRPALRVLPAARRPQPEPAHLHRRTRIPHPGRPEPAGQLGRDRRQPRPTPSHQGRGARCAVPQSRLRAKRWLRAECDAYGDTSAHRHDRQTFVERRWSRGIDADTDSHRRPGSKCHASTEADLSPIKRCRTRGWWGCRTPLGA